MVKDEYFPADLILIHSSNIKKGVAFIETKNIDGESNIKHKEVPRDFRKQMNTAFPIEKKHNENRLSLSIADERELNIIMNKITGTISCDKPNADMYTFDGLMSINRMQSMFQEQDENINSKVLFNLTYQNLLLRGSSLKNTDFIYGIVVNAGHFSKIMLNSIQSRNKYSKLTSMMNSQLQVVIILELIICLSFSFFFSIIDYPSYVI